MNAIQFLLTTTQVYFNSSETRSNIKDPNLAASKVQKTKQRTNAAFSLEQGSSIKPRADPGFYPAGTWEERDKLYICNFGVVRDCICKNKLLTKEEKYFCGYKKWRQNRKKKSQIWKSYKNNKWIICSFSSIYWKTLEHVLNSVQLGFSSCSYYSLSHLHFFAFFFKKDMYLVTCSWLFIRHHLSAVCMFLPPQLSAFNVYLSLLSPRSPSPITHTLPLRPTHRPHGKLERISIFRLPSIHP